MDFSAGYYSDALWANLKSIQLIVKKSELKDNSVNYLLDQDSLVKKILELKIKDMVCLGNINLDLDPNRYVKLPEEIEIVIPVKLTNNLTFDDWVKKGEFKFIIDVDFKMRVKEKRNDSNKIAN